MKKLNDFQILLNTNSPNSKWLAFLPNSTKKYYGGLMCFPHNFNFWAQPQNKETTRKLLKLFFNGNGKYAKFNSDFTRNPTLEEFLTFKNVLENANAKYNKKTKKIIFFSKNAPNNI